MVEAGLGYSILADLVLQKQDYQVAIRPLAPVVERKIGLYQRDPELMPLANRQFIDYLLAHVKQLP